MIRRGFSAANDLAGWLPNATIGGRAGVGGGVSWDGRGVARDLGHNPLNALGRCTGIPDLTDNIGWRLTAAYGVNAGGVIIARHAARIILGDSRSDG